MSIPQDFINDLSRTGGPALPAKFEVSIEGITHTDNLKFRCHQAVLPGLTIATSQYGTGLPEKNNPYRATFEDITLGFYCTDGTGGKDHHDSLPERSFFEEWQSVIFPKADKPESGVWNPRNGNLHNSPNRASRAGYDSWPVAYRNQYEKTIKIKKLRQVDGKVGKIYTLHKAWPVTISDTQLDWSEEEILKIEVIFSYDWWTTEII